MRLIRGVVAGVSIVLAVVLDLFVSQMVPGMQTRAPLHTTSTLSLDTDNCELVISLLGQCAARGASVIIATHDYRLADACDRHLSLTDSRSTGINASTAGSAHSAQNKEGK